MARGEGRVYHTPQVRFQNNSSENRRDPAQTPPAGQPVFSDPIRNRGAKSHRKCPESGRAVFGSRQGMLRRLCSGIHLYRPWPWGGNLVYSPTRQSATFWRKYALNVKFRTLFAGLYSLPLAAFFGWERCQFACRVAIDFASMSRSGRVYIEGP